MKFGLREIIFVAAMVGLLACSYLLVFKKAAQRRADITADIAKKQRDLVELDRATAGIADVSKKIDDLQKAIEFFESKLPQAKEIHVVLKDVTDKARDNNLTVKTFRTGTSRRFANYSEQPIQMSLSGDFNGFYSFLLQLEKLPRITRLTQMKLEKINDKDGQMQAQMTLSIFFEPDTGSAVAGAN